MITLEPFSNAQGNHFVGISFSQPPKTKKNEFRINAKFYIDRSGLLRLNVYREKDGKNVGKMEVRPGMAEFNDLLDDMLDHMAAYED